MSVKTKSTMGVSEKQAKLEAQLERLKNGYVGRGRPANPNSDSYKKRMKQLWNLVVQMEEQGKIVIKDKSEMNKWV